MLRKFIFAVVSLALLGGMALTGCSTDDNPVAEEEGSDGGWPPSGEGKVKPTVIPFAEYSGEDVIIYMENSIISGMAMGYGVMIMAKNVTFNNFKCILDNYEYGMIIEEDVTIELTYVNNEIHEVEKKLTANGTVKLKGNNGYLNLFAEDEEEVQRMAECFSAAEGYKINVSRVSDAKNNEKKITINVYKL